jgi:hypothetical protein
LPRCDAEQHAAENVEGAVRVQIVGRIPRSKVPLGPVNIPIQACTNVGVEFARRGRMKASTKLKPMMSTSQRLNKRYPASPSQPDLVACRA